eukprot:TRINITY_DN1468_c0_g4_i2.p1 TRINITY_DN1468_c0_g4~~TRINITY_DN1468_c0_g4_i2.p1  ORF type:complete len:147 (-),score=3.79 TRINITY_DN1468_c0_g4_i2:416-856(-)
MTSRRTVELCYDVVSPWAYIGYSRLMALKQNASKWKEVDITLTPVFLGGVMKLAGNKPPITVPKKFAHMQDDLRRTSQHYGIPFVFPTSFPVMTIGVQRLLTGVKLEVRRTLKTLCIFTRTRLMSSVGHASHTASRLPPLLYKGTV